MIAMSGRPTIPPTPVTPDQPVLLRLVGCGEEASDPDGGGDDRDTREAGLTALRLIDSMSRRIDRLARDLRILSHFDDPTDGSYPRAA